MKESQEGLQKTHKSIPQNILNSLMEDNADLILILCFALTCILYALLMVNDRVPVIGLIILGLLFLIYYFLNDQAVIGTPMEVPILGLLTLLLVSLSISINFDFTLPKVYGVILGVSLFIMMINYMRTPPRVHLSIIGLVLLSVGVSVLGLVGTDWPENKLFSIPLIYDLLPKLLDSVPRSTSGGGIHANIMGGSLSFFVPLLASLLWDGGAFDPSTMLKGKWLKGLQKQHYKLIITIALCITIFLLLLTQSRGAYLGTVIGLLVLAIWKDRRFLWLIPLMIGSGVIGFFTIAQGDFSTVLDLLDLSAGDTLPGRLEIWRRALYLIQDFPITGSGMGTFGELTNNLYPYFTTGQPQIPHAHNTLLTVAVDLGLPALVLYASLLSCFAIMVWHTFKTAQPFTRVLLIGLSCGLLAHQVFGLLDAYMLGTKLGVVMWIYFGLATTLFIQSINNPLAKNQTTSSGIAHIFRKPGWRIVKPYIKYTLFGMSSWILFSLVTTAFINISIILNLIIAIILGSILGVLLTIHSIQYFTLKRNHER